MFNSPFDLQTPGLQIQHILIFLEKAIRNAVLKDLENVMNERSNSCSFDLISTEMLEL